MNAAKRFASLAGLALVALALFAPAAQGAFGIESFSVTAKNEDETVDFQAGSHPFEYEVTFEMKQDAKGRPEGILRDLVVDLPPGLVGNPTAVTRCSGTDFEGQTPHCPGDSQVGMIHVKVRGIDQ